MTQAQTVPPSVEKPDTDNPILVAAARISRETGGFTGGPLSHFEEVGQHTLITLLQNGLRPDHRVLDVGCGALRLGYWIVRLLDPDRYFGLEPSKKWVAAGLHHAIGPELEALKRPRFHHAADFNFGVFGVRFDYVVARSIFTHAGPKAFCTALESFRDHSTPSAIMLASYRPGEAIAKRPDGITDVFDSEKWLWRKYPKEMLQGFARERGLQAEDFGEPFGSQVWLRITRA